MKFLIFCSMLLLLLVSLASASNFKVNPNTRFIIDQFNRSRIFHGVNAVYKLPPYYPPTLNSFDAFLSLSDQDFKNLNSWGLGFIRLYVSWEGTESIRGKYNTTYLGILKNIVQNAARYNVTILLDAHQDLGSRKFCGEGLPDWAVNRTNFPAPLSVNISYDSEGHANLTDCSAKEFGIFYTTHDVRNAFKSLYDNVDGIGDSFANFWKAVADVFKNEPNVLGYELLNEPATFGLDLIDLDLHHLQPMYKKIHQKIREVDNQTIIFFEPAVTDVISVGFTEGPGGKAYNDRQVFSYHTYCPSVTPSGEPIIPAVCQTADSAMTKVKAKKAEELGLAAILSEFGALSSTQKSVDEVARVTDLADQYLHSWSYWQFKWYDDFTTAARPGSTESFYNVDGSLQTPKVKALARSYAFATCGVPKSQKFSATTGDFEFSYQLGKSCQGQPTEIFLSQEYYYPKGMKSQFKGCEGCTLVGGNNYFVIQVPDSIKEGTLITLSVSASSKTEEKKTMNFIQH